MTTTLQGRRVATATANVSARAAVTHGPVIGTLLLRSPIAPPHVTASKSPNAASAMGPLSTTEEPP
eukprot:15480690-Alexandrium_andersonii.AAC.1